MGANPIDQRIPIGNCSLPIVVDDQYEEGPVSEQLYINEIPPFVATTLERLYATVYCTLVRIAAYESLNNVSTYVSRSESVIKTIILFRQAGRDVKVINQQIGLSATQIGRFCDKIFNEFKNVQTVGFYALNCSLEEFRYPFQQTAAIEENIVLLPPTRDAYLKSLRGQFRKQLLAAEEGVRSVYPSYRLIHYARQDIPGETVNDILDLVKQRTIVKGIDDYTLAINRKALQQTLDKYGEIIVGTIDGKICSGSIGFRVDRRSFLTIAAYDTAYSEYMLGNLIWFAAISRAIERKCEECWLMGGAADHKSRFRAKCTIFNNIVAYRSRFHALTNWQTYGRYWADKEREKIKRYIKARASKDTFIGQLLSRILTLNKKMRSRSGGQLKQKTGARDAKLD